MIECELRFNYNNGVYFDEKNQLMSDGICLVCSINIIPDDMYDFLKEQSLKSQ